MKKLLSLIPTTSLVAFALVAATPAAANSSWVSIGTSSAGSRIYVRKNVHQGQYRQYDTAFVGGPAPGQFSYTANCQNWTYHNGDAWQSVYPDTFADDSLKYICN